MPRGNNISIPSNTGSLQRTLFSERQTILVLNPNNGILYVRMQGSADPTTWDWVVPSQSRAYLPGPWLEYGLFYVDQSGAGATGNVTVFESDQKFDMPDYAAIGVARLAQQTSMDVVEGVQPANPGAGIARLWVDTNGFLHILMPSGTDYVVADTGTTLGGALAGTLPNPTPANLFDAPGLIRAAGSFATPNTGEGVEIYADTTAHNGIIQSLRRPSGTWNTLYLQGLNLVLAPQGGNINLNASPIVNWANNSVPLAAMTNITQFGSQTLGTASTTSASLVPLTSALGITSRNALIWIHFNYSIQLSNPSALATFSVYRDGVDINNVAAINCITANYAMQMCFDVYDTPSAGNHTYTIYWSVNAGSISNQPGVNGEFSIMEIAR